MAVKNIKLYILEICIILSLIISIICFVDYIPNRKIITDEKSSNLNNSKALTMMYETEDGSGEYQVSSDTSWPQEGYVFNMTLSKCEKGGTLSWNSETKRVIMQTSGSDRCYIYFDKAPTTLANYIIENVYTGIDGDNGLYYHDGVGSYTNAYLEEGDNSYRYSGGDYELTSTATSAGYTNLFTSTNTETNGLINFYCNGNKQYVGFFCSSSYSSYYTTAYNETTHYSTLIEALEETVSAGYLTKDNVNNFVCFGSGETICPTENLYRIIGVFDGQVKLIKYDYATSEMLGSTRYSFDPPSVYRGYNTINDAFPVFYPDGGGSLQLLNSNYIDFLGESLSNMIDYHLWQTTNTISDFVFESNNNLKVGLINWGDYIYSYHPNYWDLDDFSYSVASYNCWIYMGDYEYILEMTDCTGLGDVPCTWYISAEGGHSNTSGMDSEWHAVRPTFYLNSNVTYVSGSGTQTDPYRIA